MIDRLRRAWRELVRPEPREEQALLPRVGPEPGEDLWEWAQRRSIEWQLHVEEGELRMDLARQEMRARVLSESSGATGSGERRAE